jgi:hypothetical protein
LFLFAGSGLVQAQIAGADICNNDGPWCSTDPTYRFFEKVQKKAYCATPAGQQMLEVIRQTQAMKAATEEVDKLLRSRPNSLNWDSSFSDKDSAEIRRKVFGQKLPTCYENPLVYYVISQYINDVERARKQLKMPLKAPPKYGSLPTAEINAYTYPAVTDKDVIDKRGSVIGFNVQLFMFAYQMTKVTLPTISVSQELPSRRIAIDFSQETATRAIESNPDLKINFAMAILEFLQLVPPSTEALDRKYDADLMSFTTAIELFSVAHEYGHLIKGHTPKETKTLQLASEYMKDAAPVEALIGVRSWQQELEADSTGIQILNQILKNRVSDSTDDVTRQSAQLRQIYALYGSLFYFKSSEILEKARYIAEHDVPPPSISAEEKAYVRALADGRATKQQKLRYPEIQLKGHPPAWLRLERAARIVAQCLDRERFSEDAKTYSRAALGMIQNLDTLWNVSLPRLPTIIKAVRENALPPEVGYVQSPAAWVETFLQNPKLQQAIAAFRGGVVQDDDIIRQYSEAISADWLLLSGLQVRWAEEVLSAHDGEALGDAMGVLALSGDKQSLSMIKKLDVSAWQEDERLLLSKVVAFLERNGRDTSVSALDKIRPSDLKLTYLLCFPAKLDSVTPIGSLIPSEISPEIMDFLRHNRAVVPDRSLASMALFMLIARVDPSVSSSFWSDLLLRAGKVDAALSYAEFGISVAGPNASLENAVGNALSARGDLRGANQHYEASLKLGRDDGWPEMNMALNYSNLSELDEAERWFRRALDRRATARSEGEYAEYLNNFAWFLATKAKSSEESIREALKISLESNVIVGYRDPNFLDTLAECQAVSGDLKSAIESSRAALALLPNDSSLRNRYEKRLTEFESKQPN